MAASNVSLFLDAAFLGLKEHRSCDYLQPVALVSFYMYFVLNLGPKYMKNRTPFNLKLPIAVYNLAQIISNAIVFLMSVRLVPNFSPRCAEPSLSNTHLDATVRKLHYYFMLLKFLDLFDTVFFVLRKKNNQISFLHLHHHSAMALSVWATLKYIPGGVVFYVFLWNTLVHAVMYVYYLLSLWGAAKAVWWKKYLTQLQLMQHFSIFFIFTTHFFNSSCGYPKWLLFYYLCNNALSIFLFLKFYFKNYKKAVMKCG